MPFTDEERAAAERLQPGDAAFVPGPEPRLSFAARHDGACVFLDGDAHRCGLHRAAGPQALPLTCRMFPRVVRHDTIGTRLSLSHYCPTAAGLLFEDADVRIVEAPAPLVDIGPLDGLDARGELPPLLRPDVLMDVESYRAWESLGVQILTTPRGSAQDALDSLAEVTRQITAWRPGGTPLIEVVDATTDVGSRLAADHPERGLTSSLDPSSSAVKRWLAARLFGNWLAYQGRGLETIVRYLQACLDVFAIELARDRNTLEAIRRADYLIVHEADSQDIARLLEPRNASL